MQAKAGNTPKNCLKKPPLLYIILHKYLHKLSDNCKYDDIICTIVYITCTEYRKAKIWSLTETSTWT